MQTPVVGFESSEQTRNDQCISKEDFLQYKQKYCANSFTPSVDRLASMQMLDYLLQREQIQELESTLNQYAIKAPGRLGRY